MQTAEVLQQIPPRLQAAFGSRFRGALLFGSEARGEAEPDSDLDLLVRLEEPVEFSSDLATIVHALYPLQLALPERPLHALPVAECDFDRQDLALFRIARSEGRLL